jgi:hypothetical protein
MAALDASGRGQGEGEELRCGAEEVRDQGAPFIGLGEGLQGIGGR